MRDLFDVRGANQVDTDNGGSAFSLAACLRRISDVRLPSVAALAACRTAGQPYATWRSRTLAAQSAARRQLGDVARIQQGAWVRRTHLRRWPGSECHACVLDLLDRHGAKASFFCIGRRASSHPEIVRDIIRRSHSVENHSHQHPSAFAFYLPHALSRRSTMRSWQSRPSQELNRSSFAHRWLSVAQWASPGAGAQHLEAAEMRAEQHTAPRPSQSRLQIVHTDHHDPEMLRRARTRRNNR
jgi:hypothetical protein